MRNKKRFIKKSVVLGITAISLMVATLTTGESSASAAKLKKAGDYEVTKYNVPDYYDSNVNVFKAGNTGIAAVIKEQKVDSKGRYALDKKGNDILESYKITWSESGKAKKTKVAKAGGHLLKSDNKGRMFYFAEKKEGKLIVDHLYVCNSKGKRIKDIEVSKLRKFYIPDEERDIYNSTGLIDFEVKGKYIDILMTEFGKETYSENVYSLQRFNWKTGKFVKAYHLKYSFDRIVDGKLYGGAGILDQEYDVKPMKEGCYVYNKSGRKCLYQKEIDYSYKYDVVDDKIIYKETDGIYMLDMSEDAEPELLISAKEFPLFKKYSNWDKIYAIDEDEFYISFGYAEDSREVSAVYKFKKK